MKITYLLNYQIPELKRIDLISKVASNSKYSFWLQFYLERSNLC